MASIAAVISGNASIGPESNPDYTAPVLGSAGTIDGDSRQKITIAAAGSAVLPFPAGITKCKFVWIKGTDANGDLKSFSVETNNSTVTTNIPSATEILLTDNDAAAQTAYTKIEVHNLDGAAAIIIEFIIAGLSTD